MEIFKNKFLVKLIASICIFLTLFNFSMVNKVYAEDAVWGGVLIKPIVNLLGAIGDAIMELLHKSIQSQSVAILKLEGATKTQSFWGTLWSVAVGIVAAGAFIGVAIATAGIAAAAAAAIGVTTTFSIGLGTVAVGGVIGYLAGTATARGVIPEDIYLPAFSVTPEEIFSNKIVLFDINFFDPMPPHETHEVVTQEKKITLEDKTICHKSSNWENEKWMKLYDESEGFMFNTTTDVFYSNGIEEYPGFEFIFDTINAGKGEKLDFSIAEKYTISASISGLAADNHREILIYISTFDDSQEKHLYTIISEYTDIDTGFSTSIDIQEHANTITQITNVVSPIYIESTAAKLQSVVSTWYFILRNLAILVLMLVLIYTGIRIVIGSTAGEKAKYKERLIDWLVALCLLMIMHYIMVFAIELNERLIKLVTNLGGTNGNVSYIQLTDKQFESAKKIFEGVDNKGITTKIIDGQERMTELGALDENDKALMWKTDLAGAFRIQSQEVEEGTAKWVGYMFSYLVLVLYTLFFAWTYLKRVVYMAFLTIIAPLVAMTYPIDKITDGKAQAFDAWLKEYIFNLLIQPLHLLLYTVLISSAYYLATDSPLYALVAIGFMTPAEKLLRRFFGFEKAKTPGLLGGAAGAALTFSGLQKIMGHKPKVANQDNSSSSGKKDSKDKVRFSNRNQINGMRAIGGEPSTSAGTVATPSGQATEGDDGGSSGIGGSSYDDTGLGDDGTSSVIGGSSYYDTDLGDGQDDNGVAPAIFEANGLDEMNAGPEPEDGNVQVPTPEQEYFPPTTFGERMKERFRRPGILRAIGATYGAFNRNISKQMKDRIKRAHPIKTAGRFTAKAAGAILFGSAAVIAGTASGDPSKVGQYMAAGVVGGAKLGGGIADKVTNTANIDGNTLGEAALIGLKGEDYKDVITNANQRQWERDEQNINFLMQTKGLTRGEAKEFLKGNVAKKCYKNGIEDIEDIAAISEMTNRGGVTLEEAMGARYYATKRLPSNIDQSGDSKKYIERWKKEYEDAGYGERSGELAKQTFDLAIKFNSAKSGLTKNP